MQSGVAPERFVTDLADYLRTLLLISAGIKREAVLGMPSDRMPEAVRNAWDRPRIELANELALQLYRDIRYSVNQRFELELAISRLASLSSVRTPHALVQEVQALQEALVHEAAYRARTPGAEEPEPAQQDQKAQEIDAAAPPEVSGITVEQVESIISRFRTQRISVAALLSRARQWYLDGNDLAIIFADEFGANALTADVEPVQGAAKAVLGLDRLSVRILTEDAPDGRASAGDGREADPAVDMVKRVFRGEIVEDKS
jgi:DNA polymerase-3 subunit gamma/tau